MITSRCTVANCPLSSVREAANAMMGAPMASPPRVAVRICSQPHGLCTTPNASITRKNTSPWNRKRRLTAPRWPTAICAGVSGVACAA